MCNVNKMFILTSFQGFWEILLSAVFHLTVPFNTFHSHNLHRYEVKGSQQSYMLHGLSFMSLPQTNPPFFCMDKQEPVNTKQPESHLYYRVVINNL